MKGITIGAMAFFLLSACNQGQQQQGNYPNQQYNSQQPQQQQMVPAVPSAAPASLVIPAGFLGVWDYEGGICDPESDMRVEIDEDTMSFYESSGTVQSVRDEAGITMVTLAMSGEGGEYSDTIGLRFTDGGTRLMVINSEYPERAPNELRMRCAG